MLKHLSTRGGRHWPSAYKLTVPYPTFNMLPRLRLMLTPQRGPVDSVAPTRALVACARLKYEWQLAQAEGYATQITRLKARGKRKIRAGRDQGL